jgi:hypothetical protein
MRAGVLLPPMPPNALLYGDMADSAIDLSCLPDTQPDDSGARGWRPGAHEAGAGLCGGAGRGHAWRPRCMGPAGRGGGGGPRQLMRGGSNLIPVTSRVRRRHGAGVGRRSW